MLKVFLLLLLIIPSVSHADEGTTWVVSPNGNLTTIQAALDQAQPSDIIEVHGGIYDAPLVIEKTVTLVGLDNPVVDGKGEGDLVVIAAPDVLLKGFVLRNSGSSIHHENTGVSIQAANVVVENNVLENVLFGIDFANAHGSIARNNIIRGQELEESLRGDGIRIWYSNNVQLIGNEVTATRDVLISYANNLKIENNSFHDNRYGLHFMFSNDVVVLHNTFENNSVGAFLMYSQNIELRENDFAYNRGTSGYGLALKDMDGVVAVENAFIGNQTGLYLDNSPSLYDTYNHFTDNIFAYNDMGLLSLPSVERNIFQGNSFLENSEQLGIWGREVENRNIWSQDGVGNYWDDYVGYDQDSNGIGDTSYRADKLFESLTDRYAVLKLFKYSPAAQAVEFTASAFPIFRPFPKVVDDAPLMNYTIPAHLQPIDTPVSFPFLALSLGLIGVSLSLLVLDWRYRPATSHQQEQSMIVVNNLVKKYGNYTALDGMSFTIQSGESVALWGTNGAGKTSTIRCLLGVLSFEGSITVNGLEVARNSKTIRSIIGYIPQEAVFPDLTVKEALTFHARLKKVSPKALPQVLEQVGLLEQINKPVRALSGGMKQRLALAVALLGNPPILLLDEPTANLDAQARQDFLQLVQSLNHAGKTIIFSTHRVDEVMALARRVLILKDGKVSVECQPANLMEKLGLQQSLRILVDATDQAKAINLLTQSGYSPIMNTRAFYVTVGAEGKIAPLRLLEAAQIVVNDFDVVDNLEKPHDRPE